MIGGRAFAAAALILTLTAAGAANGSTVLVEYALEGTFLFNGIPFGPAGTGRATMTLPATPVTRTQRGYSLRTFSLAQAADFSVYAPLIQVTGNLALSLLFPQEFRAIPSISRGTLLFFPSVGPAGLAGQFHCVGFCGVLGTGQIPASSPVPLTGVGTVGFGASVRNGLLSMRGGLPRGSPLRGLIEITFEVVGTEVSRTPLPEPSGAVLLSLAALTGAGAAWARGRRRDERP